MIPTPEIARELPHWPAIEEFIAHGGRGRRLILNGLWGASDALLLAALTAKSRLLALTSDDESADDLADDLVLFGVDRDQIALLPTLEKNEDGLADPVTFRARMVALEEVRRGASVIIIPLTALCCPLPAESSIASHRIPIRAGDTMDMENLCAEAVRQGFRRVPLVSMPGEVSLRGEIFDIFSYSSRNPVRVEVLDDEIESIRFFDSETQRSIQTFKQTDIFLAAGSPAQEDETPATWLESLPADAVLAELEPSLLAERTGYLGGPDTEAGKLLAAARNAARRFPTLALNSLPANKGLNFTVNQIPPPPRDADILARLQELASDTTLIACARKDEKKRLVNRFGEKQTSGLNVAIGRLSKGFRLESPGLTIISHDELAGLRTLPRARCEPSIPTRAIKGFYELKRGDLVVHALHGIARFTGIKPITKSGTEEDHLELLFAGEVSLYVPVSRIELIQKYIGGGQISPRLDRLGSRSFSGRKEKVRRELLDMAAELLEVQATRTRTAGIPFPEDDEIQREFEAAFPFRETPDQLKVMEEIRSDMIANLPMDRLVCGDVGFGKTELAMRAAFKAILAGRQTAVLVPTTILAGQHYETFRARTADWPVTVEVLSRFITPRRQKDVIRRTAAGQVDILIGTHRLLSGDVEFADLGLVVVDEEQRFGVAHKEKLKQLRALVDILTLTATPIPRTLHMSLSGLRDISALTTPPTGRQEIQTLLRPRSEDLIQTGIRRELARGGQVFFLHNRVQSIDRIHHEIQTLVPEARIIVGHGQMPERLLEKNMQCFISGEADILVSTSIIESGLDIPRANTIFIDRADRFGLADLHQLRGRVGRYRHKAWAYLLYDEYNPPKGDAALRLKALEELSGLGAGFQIAMRDLEIRGAGNILGPQQSGHIAAIGYDMYCRLLNNASAALMGETPTSVEGDAELMLAVPARIPPDYIPDEEMRIEALRLMEEGANKGKLQEVEAGLRDRYGRPPLEVLNLARVFHLRRLAIDNRLAGIRYAGPDRFVVTHPAGRPPQGKWLEPFSRIRSVELDETHLLLPSQVEDAQQAILFLIDCFKKD